MYGKAIRFVYERDDYKCPPGLTRVVRYDRLRCTEEVIRYASKDNVHDVWAANRLQLSHDIGQSVQPKVVVSADVSESMDEQTWWHSIGGHLERRSYHHTRLFNCVLPTTLIRIVLAYSRPLNETLQSKQHEWLHWLWRTVNPKPTRWPTDAMDPLSTVDIQQLTKNGLRSISRVILQYWPSWLQCELHRLVAGPRTSVEMENWLRSWQRQGRSRYCQVEQWVVCESDLRWIRKLRPGDSYWVVREFRGCLYRNDNDDDGQGVCERRLLPCHKVESFIHRRYNAYCQFVDNARLQKIKERVVGRFE